MKKLILFLILMYSSFQASAYVSPVGFSFTHKGEGLNFPPKDWSVYGLRTNFFGAENKSVVGFDIGGLNITDELMGGVQIGGFNLNNKKSYLVGMQFGVISNVNKGESLALGWQLAGISNHNEGAAKVIGAQMAIFANIGKKTKVYGTQLAIYNRAETVVGVQLGVVNYCDNLHGFQIGLLNVCKSCLIEIMPGVNIGI